MAGIIDISRIIFFVLETVQIDFVANGYRTAHARSTVMAANTSREACAVV
jgi:hypothetical protein